jgi:hypothetical protein
MWIVKGWIRDAWVEREPENLRRSPKLKALLDKYR